MCDSGGAGGGGGCGAKGGGLGAKGGGLERAFEAQGSRGGELSRPKQGQTAPAGPVLPTATIGPAACFSCGCVHIYVKYDSASCS